ncbi:hypothetical protein PybrP1_011164 [[Pythium] brassicae (nom. inval.)]|nr:hypothetical protein PybrP1_011164 [[Pythium] brassicae (nom. inval.)]
MGTKHSVPVTSTQSEGPTMPYSSFASSAPRGTGARQSDGGGTGADALQGHHYGKLNAVAIRPHEAQHMSPLDVKISTALKEFQKKRLHENKDPGNPFTRILLKFPIVAKAFNSVRSTFEEFDKGKKGYIVFSDVENAFEKLGMNLSAEEIGQVVQESDMLENGRLTFKEFLVCLAIGFKIPAPESEQLSIFYAPLSTPTEKDAKTTSRTLLFGEGNKLRIAFQLAVDAFLWFDVDGNGLINRDEMAMRLGTSTQLHSPTKSTLKERAGSHRDVSDVSINSEIWERRFNEMDWNHDGTIQFKEFLLAFESWVGLDDDDAADEAH